MALLSFIVSGFLHVSFQLAPLLITKVPTSFCTGIQVRTDNKVREGPRVQSRAATQFSQSSLTYTPRPSEYHTHTTSTYPCVCITLHPCSMFHAPCSMQPICIPGVFRLIIHLPIQCPSSAHPPTSGTSLFTTLSSIISG